jgi:hypothetical protein
VGHMSAWALRLLALVLCLPAGAAAAQRGPDQVGARTDRLAPSSVAPESGLANSPDQPDDDGDEPGEVTGALPKRAAASSRRAAAPRTERKAARRSEKAAPKPKAAAPKAGARRTASKTPVTKAVPLPPMRPHSAPVAAAEPTPQPDTTGSVEARPMVWPELPAPPSPTVIETITYDFTTGMKRTVLRDGTSYQEAFDPKAFYRVGATPAAANGQRSEANRHSGESPALPEAK